MIKPVIAVKAAEKLHDPLATAKVIENRLKFKLRDKYMICRCGKIIYENIAYYPNCGKKLHCENEMSDELTEYGSAAPTVIENRVDFRMDMHTENKVEFPSAFVMSLEDMYRCNGKRSVGELKIYSDKVEFVSYGNNKFVDDSFEAGIVDCFHITEISAVKKSMLQKLFPYIEIVLKNGKKCRYSHKREKYIVERILFAVNSIKDNLLAE